MDDETRAYLDAMRADFNDGIERVLNRLGHVGLELTSVRSTLHGLYGDSVTSTRLSALEARFSAMEARFSGIEQSVNGIGLALRHQGEMLEQLLTDMMGK